MKLFSKLGGLVAVVAILMAAGALLSPSAIGQTVGDGPLEGMQFGGTDFPSAGGVDTTPGATEPILITDNEATWVTLEVTGGTLSLTKTGDGTTSLRQRLVEDPDNAGSYQATWHFTAPDVDEADVVAVTAKVLGEATNGFQFVNVIPGPTALDAKITKGDESIALNDDTASATITATLSRGDNKAFTEEITVTTTRGLVVCEGSSVTAAAINCKADAGSSNNDPGEVEVTLTPEQRAGIATVRFTSGNLIESVDVIIADEADAITAEAAASTMQAVGTAASAGEPIVPETRRSTLITVTVVDSNGNAVSGQTLTVADKTKDIAADKVALDLGGTPGGKIPSCLAADPPTDDDGTNGSGQCVFDVRAGEDAALGEHDIEIVFSTSIKANVAITVVGKVATISTDAPALVEPSSLTTITATATDKNGDSVGPNVVAKVEQFEGDGLAGSTKTKTNDDGEFVFTFRAPTQAQTSSLAITIGEFSDTISIDIGTEPVVEPEPVEPVEPDPEMMAHGFSSTLGSGVTLTSYTGSIGELAMDAAEAGVSVVAVTVDGEYITYIVGAPTFANEPFSDQFPDGLDGVIVVAVVN